MATKECSVNVDIVVEVFITSFQNIAMGLTVHQRDHLFGIATDHRAPSPCNNCRKEPHDLNVLKG